MPAIKVDMSQAEGYENLPLNEYLGQIDKIVYKAPREAGKFPQLMVTYQVIDGELLGKSSNEWLSLSPKAAFRTAKWFGKFGIDLEETELILGDPDAEGEPEDGDELTDPDLVGTQVIFKVYKERDKRVADPDSEDAYRVRTALVSVEDDEPAPAPKATKRAAAPPAEDDDDTGDDSDDEPEEKPATRVPRRVAQPAKPARRTLR